MTAQRAAVLGDVKPALAALGASGGLDVTCARRSRGAVMKTFDPKPTIKNSKLTHHRLRVYWRALKLAQLTARYPIRRTTLRRQAERAVDSVALNIAEAAGLSGRRNKSQFRIARGSALEVIAAYELAAAYDEAVPLEDVVAEAAIVVAMLSALCR